MEQIRDGRGEGVGDRLGDRLQRRADGGRGEAHELLHCHWTMRDDTAAIRMFPDKPFLYVGVVSQTPEAELCKECGLCCDGTFYGTVAVAEAERERALRVGLRVVDEDGALRMPQPCSALRGHLCAVYEDRPSACA